MEENAPAPQQEVPPQAADPEAPEAGRRRYIKAIADAHRDPIARVRRLYLEEPSFCLGRDRNVEFEIKRKVAEYLNISYRSIVFAGSAQLGFSPAKGTDFKPGESDLDLAAIDINLFQDVFQLCLEETNAFTDLRGFTHRGGQETADRLREYIVRRGMIPISFLPACRKVRSIESFLARLSDDYVQHFSDITLAIYMSEYMFCWKQHSAVRSLR